MEQGGRSFTYHFAMFHLMLNCLFSFPLQETPPPFEVPLKPVEILSQCNSCLGLPSYTGKEQQTSSVPLQEIQIPSPLENCSPDKEFLLGKKHCLFFGFHLCFLVPKSNLKEDITCCWPGKHLSLFSLPFLEEKAT